MQSYNQAENVWRWVARSTDTYLWQAEGDGPRVNTGVSLQGEHILVG